MNTILDTIISIINDGQTTPAQQKWRNDNLKRAEEIARYRRYMIGDQDSGLNDKMRRLLNLTGEQDFNFNQCVGVIETVANRLQVLSITGDTGKGRDSTTANEWASELLDWNYFDQLQVDVYDACLRDGDGYIMVSWDEAEGQPVLTHELAFDGENGVIVIHNRYDAAVIDVAVKVWSEALDEQQDLIRINVYYPDRVAKYTVINGVVSDYYDPDRPEEHPLPWVDRRGQPIGVPVVQFPNRSIQSGGHGVSKLRDIVPLQHGLNVTMHSMVGTSLLGAFPVNLMIGYHAPKTVEPGMFYEIVAKDDAGKMVAPGEETISWLNAIRLEQVRGAALTPFIETVEFFERSIEKVGNVPSYKTGANESGEALKQRESALLGEVRRAHITLGNAWERVLRLAGAVQNAYGTPAPEVRRWRCQWKPAEVRNDLERADIIDRVSKHLQGSDEIIHQIGQLLDLSEDRIAEIKDQIAGEREQSLSSMLSRLPGYARGEIDEPQQATGAPAQQLEAVADGA